MVPNRFSEEVTPQADAQASTTSANNFNYGDCAVRQTRGPLVEGKPELCWIDFSDLGTLSTTPKKFTKQIGRYRLTFDLAINEEIESQRVTARSERQSNSAFGYADSRDTIFVPYTGDATRPIIHVDQTSPTATFSPHKMARFTFRNIRIVDTATGTAVPNYNMVLADAETTKIQAYGEHLVMDDLDPNKLIEDWGQIAPDKFYRACLPAPAGGSNFYGRSKNDDGSFVYRNNDGDIVSQNDPGARRYVYEYYRAGDPNREETKDIACQESRGVWASPDNRAGTYLWSANSPKSLEITSFTTQSQAFALALPISLMRTSQKVDTSMEQAATGQATNFDTQMFLQNGNQQTPVGKSEGGRYSEALRLTTTRNANGVLRDGNPRALSTQVFRSQASGDQVARLFDRYKPQWTCNYRDSNNVTYTLNEDYPTAGDFSLVNNKEKGFSEIRTANQRNRAVSCDVEWQPRFKPATLQLQKAVSGSAATFADNQNRTFKLRYQCNVSDAYKRAYGETTAQGESDLLNGATSSVTGLPAGTQCRVLEDFGDSNPRPKGQDWDLTWTVNQAGEPSAAPRLEKQNGIDTQILTLTEGTNAVSLRNNYDARLGTLDLSKHVTGDPVAELGSPKDYRFHLTCEGTNFAQDVTLNLAGNGELSGSTQITGIPTGRDCTLSPLTGLDRDQTEFMTFDGRDVTFNGQNTPADGSGSYHFELNENPSSAGAEDMHIEAHYSYKTRELNVVKQLTGPGAEKARGLHYDYPVTVRCQRQGFAESLVEAEGNTNVQNYFSVPNVPVGATCRVEEGDVQDPANDGIHLADQPVSMTVPDGTDGTKKVDSNSAEFTVPPASRAATVPVIVTNDYELDVAPVNLEKLVESSGITAQFPDSYELQFRCGTRNVRAADGSFPSVSLTGSVRLGANEAKRLVADVENSEYAALVNDQDGALGVPVGNECTFTETTPSGLPSGVNWSSDVSQDTHQVTEGDNQVTVTNIFEPAGDGLTINQNFAGNARLNQEVEYQLTCEIDGAPVVLSPEEETFTLNVENPRHEIDSSVLREGAECRIKEIRDESTSGLRTMDGITFPIRRDSSATLSQDDGSEQRYDFADNALMEGSFTIGQSTVINLEHSYAFRMRNITAQKLVEFAHPEDPMISAAGQDALRNRGYTLTLQCLPPAGAAAITVTDTLTGVEGADTLATVPAGSRCDLVEQDFASGTGLDSQSTITLEGGDGSGPAVDEGLRFVAVNPENPRNTGDIAAKVTNTFDRRSATVELNKIARTPIDVQATFPEWDLGPFGGDTGPSHPDNGRVFYQHDFVLTCHDPGDKDSVIAVRESTITGPGQTQFADVPEGAECSISGNKFGTLNMTKDQDGLALETHLRPKQVNWTSVHNDGTTLVDEELADDATESMEFSVLADNESAPGNVINLTNTYEFLPATLRLTKEVRGDEVNLARLADNQKFDFSYQCRGVGYSYSTIGLGEVTLPNTVDLSQFSENDGVYRFESEPVQVPSGALCNFTESQPTDTPQELELSIDSPAESVRVEDAADQEVDRTFEFVNNYSRRMVDARFTSLQDGYLEGADLAGYNYHLTCRDSEDRGTELLNQTLNFDLQSSYGDGDLTGTTPPSRGQVVQVPVGAECDIDAGDSPALAPRPEVEVTQGNRAPYMEFAHWGAATSETDNPTRPLAEVAPNDVTDEMKSYSYEFAVPGSARNPGAGQAALSVAGEAMHPRATVDLTFTKEVDGDAPDDAYYDFYFSCTGESFSLQAGESHVIQDVDVNSTCTVYETEDDNPDSDAVLEFGDEFGERLSEPSLVADDLHRRQGPDEVNPDSTVQVPTGWTVRVNPVASATDLSRDGAKWAFTGINRMPGVDIDKHIDGAPLSAITGAVANTALLPDDATQMHFSYTVTNPGALPLKDFSFAEPGLAGREVSFGEGQTVTVGEDGVLPAEVCAASLLGEELAPGASFSCEFDVAVPETTEEFFRYGGGDDGTVTVAASVVGQEATGAIVRDSDSYGAIRLPESIGWMLPDTGRQTLVFILLLGLLILAAGLIRYLRNRDDEENELDETQGAEESSRS
ncbi:DUF5979 domain-containing protein [Corynebacterium sp. 11254D000AR]